MDSIPRPQSDPDWTQIVFRAELPSEMDKTVHSPRTETPWQHWIPARAYAPPEGLKYLNSGLFTVPTVSTAMTLSRFILQDYKLYSVIYFLKWGNETNWASKSSGHNEDPFLSYNLNIKRDSNPPQKDGNCSLIDILRMHV